MFNDLSEITRRLQIVCVEPVRTVCQQGLPYVIPSEHRPAWSIPEPCRNPSVMSIFDQFGKIP